MRSKKSDLNFDCDYLGYVVLAIIISIITFIFAENIIYSRIQLGQGTTLTNGICVLSPGYGLLENTNAPTTSSS